MWKRREKPAKDVAANGPTLEIAVVHFTADEATMARLDIALGPCASISERVAPLANPIMQDRGEDLTRTACLYTALTGEPDDGALTLLAQDGRGTLHRYSESFHKACAEYSERMLAASDDEWAVLEAQLDRAWMRATTWPSSYVSLRNRIGRIHAARVARENHVPFYCWHGPATHSITVVEGKGRYPNPN